MEMGRPSSSTTLPLTRPSVPSMAIVLTVFSKVLGDLQDELGLPADDSEGVEDLREAIVELDVHNGTDDRHNLALLSFDGRAHGELALVGNGGQSLGDVAGDGLPDEPGGGASCGAQHDVRGSPH